MKSPIAQHFYIGAGVPQHQQEAVRFSDDDDGGEQHVPAAVRYTLQQVLQWPESRVCQWVREQGFGKYESAFRENLVNGEALVELDYTLLKELSVRTVGERVRLNLAIRRLRQQCLQVDIDSESPPPPTRRVPQQQQPKKMGAKRSQPAELTLPATHSTGAVSETVPPSALQNAHAAAASSVAFNASTKAGETGVSIALVPSATAGANPLLGAASAVSAMTSVTAMAAVPTATAADSAAAYAQVPGIKDLPVLPRVSLSSTAIGIGGNAGSILQRANTDMRPFATVQDRRAKQPQPHSLAHGGGGSGGGIALRRHKVGGDTGSPQSANKGSAESSLFHLKKPPTDKISSLNASKESATAASTASPQKLGVLARLDEAALEPMSAPLPRIRMLTSSQQRAASSGSPPTVAPLQQLRDAIESSRLGNGRSTGPAEEIERLGLQFQEFFGTDISVSNLADSLTVKTWNVTITGPENQARQVAIANTSSAQTILDRVRRAFDLDNDIDGDQYSLFSMTSEGGGARCLSNEELVRVFSSSENAPTDKLFLRKRHQLSRPPMGSKRSEHLQRAIERLGNIIPSTLTSPPSQQQQQQQAALPALGRSMSKWESTTEKLTKLLGERPPSELVSQNIEKYFPGNEARARHSIMRRRRHESQDGISVEGLDVATLPSATASSSKRSSRRQSKAHRRSTSSTTSSASSGSRLMQARLQALALSGDKRWSGFSSNLEPIDESLASPGPADSNLPTTITSKDDSAAEQLPQLAATSRQSKRQSKMFGGAGAAPLRNESYGSLEFSDDEDDDADSGGSLSDLSPSDSSHLSDSLGSDGDDGSDSSFCKSLGDSDIDGDEDLADVDDDSVKIESLPANPAKTASEESQAAEADSKEGGGTFGASSEALPDKVKAAVTRSGSAASRTKSSHGKKKTWIKGAPIASGSFGSVYFGMNSRTGAIMAVKEVELPKPGSASMSRNQRMADALRHELDLLKGLDHRNVVRYLGTDIDERNIYIFLEYVSGGSVSSALASFGMFPESLVRTYTAQIIEGLVYLHDQGIIHRDIKGGNVLIDQDGSVKISDFGISKRVDEVVATSKTDRRASLQGSVFWMAPEVVKDTKYTVKGDVWSLGCLVIEMMTGTHPFPDLDQMQALYSIGQRSRPHIPDDISAAGRDFLEQALQVDLGMRPTAKDLLPHSFVSDTAAPQTP